MSNKKNETDELQQYEQEAKKYEQLYWQAVGIVQYLKNKKVDKDKE